MFSSHNYKVFVITSERLHCIKCPVCAILYTLYAAAAPKRPAAFVTRGVDDLTCFARNTYSNILYIYLAGVAEAIYNQCI